MYFPNIFGCRYISAEVAYHETLLTTGADNCLELGLICFLWQHVLILNGSSKIVITGTSTVKGGHTKHARPVWAGLI